MKNTEHEMQDELRSEYDLIQLRIRKLGPQRSKLGSFVQLAPDVEKVFPNSEAANEALRFLIRVAQQDQEQEEHK